jgi:hypothetical protein
MFLYSQVLRNLISNSLKFTEKHGTVSVLAEYLPDGLPNAVILQVPNLLLENPRAGAVRITVKDDGAGLSPAQVLDIGKEGVQFNANTLQAGGGSGLGLFIGKGLVEQQGGRMQVSSEGLGKGATFMFELPMFRVEGPVPREERQPRASGEGEGGNLQEKSFVQGFQPVSQFLLVVDDALSNRKLLVRILNGKGFGKGGQL